MGIHFNSLAEAIAHFQRERWQPLFSQQNADGSWNAAGFRKAYTDDNGQRSELRATFHAVPGNPGMVFVSVFDRRDLKQAA